MILPTKSIKPVDSLFCISSFIIDILKKEELCIDAIHNRLVSLYPKAISIESIISSINFLYIIGKVEMENEIIKIKL